MSPFEASRSRAAPANDGREDPVATVVVPAHDAAQVLGDCLSALEDQSIPRAEFEVIVVDDGSGDGTGEVAEGFADVRVLRQPQRGPAAARTRGARAARAPIVVFTDADCEPTEDWLAALLEPFDDPSVVGSKGTYLTRQRSLTARFTQLEYESKYDRMRRFSSIDFVDTYAAAFRRSAFLEAGGYDEGFPVPSAEDVDLSFRLAAAGHRMLFSPEATVYHRHPERLRTYLSRKYRYAHWRVKAVATTPRKILSDSHSPPADKAQAALMVPLAALLALRAVWPPAGRMLLGVLAVHGVLGAPFVVKALRRDPRVAAAAPLLLVARSAYQAAGLVTGTVRQLLSEPAAASD